jgi:small subunit ribosomal protein S6
VRPAGEDDSDRRKERQGTVIDYEILLLLDPELTEEKQAEVIARTRALIEKGGGTFERHDAWGRRKLAYEIDHKGEGSYHLMVFTCSAETLAEVTRVLKIDDAVIRHLATRRPGERPEEPVAVGASTSEDADDEAAPADEED